MTRTNPLSTYLNDHLAGSAGALDLLETLIGHAHNAEFADVVTSVARDIRQDRETLLDIMNRLDVEVGTLKQVTAKVAEKALELKSNAAVTGDGDFSRLARLGSALRRHPRQASRLVGASHHRSRCAYEH
jgi:hypothetical protein